MAMDELDATIYAVIAFFWILLCGLVGGLLGKSRGRTAAGALFGAFLGPIGWLITVLLPAEGRKCPECLGVVPDGARRCKHCGAELVKTFKPVVEDKYFLLRNDKTEGPFTRRQIQTLISDGKLTLDTLCAVEGGEAWVPVGDIM